MPRYIIPFVDSTKWVTNNNCTLCKTIDDLYNKAKSETDSDLYQDDLFVLDNYLVVDGYNLLEVYEKNGLILDVTPSDNVSVGNIVTPKINPEITRMRQYKTSTDLFMKKVQKLLFPEDNVVLPNDPSIDVPVTAHSRWCKYCGSRKPDIYDTTKQENMNLMDIENFVVNLIEPDSTYNYHRVSISWRDFSSEAWAKTRLLRKQDYQPKDDNDGEILKEYSDVVNLHDELNPFYDIGFDVGHVYYYQVIAYDKLGKVLKKSDLLEVYVGSTDDIAPQSITDLTVKQVRELKIDNDTDPPSYYIEDSLQLSWTDPSDDDWQDTIIRMSDKFVPVDELDCTGVTSKKILINSKEDPNSLKFDKTYYFKAFPYDKTKFIPNTNGIGYIPMNNYNRKSNPAVINVVQYTQNVKDLIITGGDRCITLTWTDPDDFQWTGTKVIYKVGSMILNENDGTVVTITKRDERNKYAEVPLVIPYLNNNTKYYVGVFPMTSNDLVSLRDHDVTPTSNIANVRTDNQIGVIVGSWLESINITFEDNSYLDYFKTLGKWKVEKDPDNSHKNVLITRALQGGDCSVCFIDLFNNAYGVTVSFDYKISMVPDADLFTFAIGGGETLNTILVDTGEFQAWRNVCVDLGPGEGVKLVWSWDKGDPYAYGYVAIDNIIVTYKHE
jgi:hypothetical protein